MLDECSLTALHPQPGFSFYGLEWEESLLSKGAEGREDPGCLGESCLFDCCLDSESRSYILYSLLLSPFGV